MSYVVVWFRRNLRLHDNKALDAAIRSGKNIIPLFIFDSDILKYFPNPQDKRVSFIVDHLDHINKRLFKTHQTKLLICYGSPKDIINTLCDNFNIDAIYADEDYEPHNIQRDQNISEAISPRKLNLYCDHLIYHPGQITKKDGTAFKVFTPFMKEFRRKLLDEPIYIAEINLQKGRFYQWDDQLSQTLNKTTLISCNPNNKISDFISTFNYQYQQAGLWHPDFADKHLTDFLHNQISAYPENRNWIDGRGCSKLSPYLRFGTLSPRQVMSQALMQENNDTFVNELIWREFYAMILYRFPETIKWEFLEKYRNNFPWEQNLEIFNKFKNGQTGLPIIDAAMRQLLLEGWMSNRARMVVANFFTKNLMLDWRLGEQHFAQHLMDYELSSNLGGWQWCASVGTDAQPYFRMFNPILQSEKFDPEAKFIKKYVLELANTPRHYLHNPDLLKKSGHKPGNYPDIIVDIKQTRQKAIATFKHF